MLAYFKRASFIIALFFTTAVHADDWTSISKVEIQQRYYEGQQLGATHMLIVWDTWDFEDSYQFHVYCYPQDNLATLIKAHNAPGYYQVSKVYALDIPLEDQLLQDY